MSSCKKQSDNEISFATWGSKSEIAVVKELIADFEAENPEIKINLIHIPDNYFRKLHLLIASNLTPDVMFVNNLNSQIYVKAGKFEPLDNYIEKSTILSKDDFFSVAFLPADYKGKLYIMPRDVSNMVVYYNKDIFDKYKVPYPEDGWNTEEFLKIAKKLTVDTNNDSKTDVFGFGFESKSLFWLPFLYINGGGILDNFGHVIIDKPSSKEAIKFYSDLRNVYHVAPMSDEQASLTTSQLFMQGKIAMHLCGRWCSLTYKKDMNLRWDIVQFPKNENGSALPVDISGYAISSSSENKPAAWKFVEFMSGEYSMKKLTQTGLILPANKKIANSSVFLTSPPDNAQAFLTSLNRAVPTNVNVKYSELNDVIDVKFENLFNGKSDIDDIINIEFIEKLKELSD